MEKLHIHDNEFWQSLDRLVNSSNIIIDRPKGSEHPRFPEIIYPLDYGYLENTQSMDGGGIDIWKGSIPSPEIDAIMCTVDPMKRDSEIKILYGCTEAEKHIVYEFQNQMMMSAVMIKRQNL